MLAAFKKVWLFDLKSNTLAGITTVLALIPDALAFAFIAGVSPMTSIYTTICMLILTSFFGGRPGMVSSSAGSMAVLMTALVADHGLPYLFAATLLTGLLQLGMSRFRMSRLMKFVPKPVLTGFVNSLAILIFLSQLRYFEGMPWSMYAIVAGTLLLIYVLPKYVKVIPSPLIAVVLMTVLFALTSPHLQSIGDLGAMSAAWPGLHFPQVPLSWETLGIIAPYAISLALVGFCETLLTQEIIDEMTDARTNKDTEMRGQGIANAVSGLIGGMAGCALIAESAINVKLGGRGRLSTLTAGIVLALVVFAFGGLLDYIPVAALVGVMFMVCIEIFSWRSLRSIRRIPKRDTFVMALTVAIVVWTHNLAIGVLAGIAAHFVGARFGASSAKSRAEVSIGSE